MTSSMELSLWGMHTEKQEAVKNVLLKEEHVAIASISQGDIAKLQD